MTEKLAGACLFAQSGGPTSVINASAYGVIRTALDMPEISGVYGAAHGITGILNDTLYDLGKEDDEELALLMNTPSSALGSCRYKIKGDEDLEQIHKIFKKYGIRYFFYNGGNDSMDTCQKISNFMERHSYECRVIGVPKTIDNDLCGTDHCPGYGSAAKYIATAAAEVYKDATVYDTGMVVIMEIMGRHAGWLTGAAALAGLADAAPDLIYLPEIPFDFDSFLKNVEMVYKANNNCIVAVSEGIRNAEGGFVSEAKTSVTDGFGHAQLGGLATRLSSFIKKNLGVKVRGIELSLLQRCGAHIASQTDINEAFLAGKAAVEFACSGGTGKMVAFARDNSSGAYRCKVEFQPLSISANAERRVPREWINETGTNVTQEFIDYALPLIQGENTRKIENGLPRFARLKKIRV
ncbi:MAG: 6-phosphofructokinase [Oscillospiraceae bacterium]|jgi:6-phosphofructokinase 1|nr:6-phosphofructokinase [Oscillospiraceae bacterium]